MCKEYNGWTNYETWNVALWLDNEQGSHFYFVERAKALDTDAAQLASEIEESVKESAPELGASTYADLLGAVMSSVNWYAIAESFCETARDYAEHDA